MNERISHHESDSTSNSESGWEGFTEEVQEQVSFNRPENPSIDKDFDTRTVDQIREQQKAESLGRMRAEIFGLFKTKERAAQSKAEFEAGSSLSNADQELLTEQEAERQRSEEALRAKDEADWNLEQYGANIPAATAREAFSKEYYHLKLKIEKEQRAIEKEREMPPKESQKSYDKRQKRGEVVSEEEREHFRELESIQNLGSDTDKEKYGRRKEQAFREAEANMKANKHKFKKILKDHGLAMPKTWDDKTCGLNKLSYINSITSFLRQE